MEIPPLLIKLEKNPNEKFKRDRSERRRNKIRKRGKDATAGNNSMRIVVSSQCAEGHCDFILTSRSWNAADVGEQNILKFSGELADGRAVSRLRFDMACASRSTGATN